MSLPKHIIEHAILGVGAVDTAEPTGANDFTVSGVLTSSGVFVSAGPTYLNGAKYTNIVEIDDTDSPYSLLTTDYDIHADTSAGVITIDLPTAQVESGREIRIVDAGGSAGTNNITVTTEGSETIDGDSDGLTLVGDYASVTISCNGTNWFVVA